MPGDRLIKSHLVCGARCAVYFWLAVASLCAMMMLPARVHACGVSGPDGVWSCSLAEHEEEERPRWSVGASGVYTSTALRFGHGIRADETRHAVLATASYAPTAALSFQVSAGAAFGGQLRLPDATHDFTAGPIGAIGGSYHLSLGVPFLVFSAVLSGSSATTRTNGGSNATVHYTAFDLRLGAAIGVHLFEVLSPYAVARVFGGPVFWRDHGEALTGTDAYHVQLGVGVSWLIAERVDVFIEGVPLGEQALSGGAAVVF